MIVPSELQVTLSVLVSSSHEDSELPGAQSNVMLFSVTSAAYTLGAIQVTVGSHSMPNLMLLRYE